MSPQGPWRKRLQELSERAKEGAERAAEVARDAGERAAPVAKDALERAKPIAREGAEKSRTFLDRKREERRPAAEARETWFLTEQGPLFTAGFPDEESMRGGIQAAAEHGWKMESIANVPERRIPGGLTTLVAKQAAQRLLKPDRFLVTFRRQAAAEDTPAGGSPAPEGSD